MRAVSSRDRNAVKGWIEGQADPTEGKRILADLPKLKTGEGYIWVPSHDLLTRVSFPRIHTYDSSRTPKRGERISTPRTLAEVDLSAITAALAAAVEPGGDGNGASDAEGSRAQITDLQQRLTERERRLTMAQARIAELEAEATTLRTRLGQIATLAVGDVASLPSPAVAAGHPAQPLRPVSGPHAPAPTKPVKAARSTGEQPPVSDVEGDGTLHPAARKLLAALAQHAPARFT